MRKDCWHRVCSSLRYAFDNATATDLARFSLGTACNCINYATRSRHETCIITLSMPKQSAQNLQGVSMLNHWHTCCTARQNVSRHLHYRAKYAGLQLNKLRKGLKRLFECCF